MRLLHLLEDDTMKINEVHMQEAEPNYEVNPAQARLAAIAVKLMDKAETVTDVNLQIALTRVAQHLPNYGLHFGPKTTQDLLDIVNGEGKYFDPDMPQDNKNPIKVTKESLMKMMAYGQKMVDKEGTIKPDIAEDTEDREKENAGKMRRRIADIRFMVADMEDQISELVHLDNGDLTDQISTMKKYSDGLYAVLSRAMKIVPVYEGELNEAPGAREIAAIDKKYEELTDENQHGAAALLLVKSFGDKEELDIINAINARHKKRGNIMRSEQQLRDEIANAHYKTMKQGLFPIGEGVISDLFTVSKDEKRLKQRTGDSYDAAMVDKHTKKFEKQGLSPEDARKYAYRKVHGKPVNEVAGPEKCWDGYKKVGTKPGTGKNKGKRVNDCEKA
jgi:hypothetical protein